MLAAPIARRCAHRDGREPAEQPGFPSWQDVRPLASPDRSGSFICGGLRAASDGIDEGEGGAGISKGGFGAGGVSGGPYICAEAGTAAARTSAMAASLIMVMESNRNGRTQAL
jgi:hypothetical protein